MEIWISSLTTNLPSSIMLKLRPKSFRLIVVVAPYAIRWPIMPGSLNSPYLASASETG